MTVPSAMPNVLRMSCAAFACLSTRAYLPRGVCSMRLFERRYLVDQMITVVTRHEEEPRYLASLQK